MLKNYFKHLFINILFLSIVSAQEIKLFQVADFDLKGNVKSCMVITDYGKEIFEFNEKGFLTKSTTQYNDTDKDIVVYKYEGDELVEKRMESYKDNTLDAASSMVNFYEIDSTGPRVVKEKIISFDKQFFEAQEYQYDEGGKLKRIIISHENAVDEMRIEHTAYKQETTITYFENEVIEKSIRKSSKKLRNGRTLAVTLLKEFVDGEPNRAIESIIDDTGKLLSEQFFYYNATEKEFVPKEKKIYGYESSGVLSKVTIKTNNTESVENYIFQFDDSEHKNWVKKIITPQNSYVTRILTYYEEKPSSDSNPE
ncbi:hypothetical protein [uncultured Croceitalea sp.]|uniref:hypothetical protein n=1 Tax=uncultured Croceitalea sp. TaxID=1798908 RepID=UPI003305AFFD